MRAKMLDECLQMITPIATEAAAAATEAHGSYGNGIGEELAFWVPIALALKEYREAMENEGAPRVVKLTRRGDQWIADVFPKGIFGTLFGDLRVELWIQSGKAPSQGKVYKEKQEELSSERTGSISLVLGAGNHVNVVILDILHKLICDDEVVLVKMNPQNAFLGAYVERALAPFFQMSFVKVIYGGVQLGDYLTHHTSIDSIHLTGAVQTFNSIVYGRPVLDKKDVKPVLDKKVSAELGCFTPAIVVPGDWSEKDMDYVATTIVSGLINNASHNCCALECVITMDSWPLRRKFVEILTKKLNKKQRQVAWYKGSQEKFNKFIAQFPDALILGRTNHASETFPWAFMPGLTPEQANTQQENWCGVLQEICLQGSTPGDFLEKAVYFCNEKCWGTLSCCIIIHPETQRNYKVEFETAVAELKYGSITINAPPIFNFLPAASWGAYPGNKKSEIGSGNCAVHNTSLFDFPEKSVMYCPWMLEPIPLWADVSNKTAIVTAFLSFVQQPSILTLLMLVPPLLQASVESN
eukprot:g3177.t1